MLLLVANMSGGLLWDFSKILTMTKEKDAGGGRAEGHVTAQHSVLYI